MKKILFYFSFCCVSIYVHAQEDTLLPLKGYIGTSLSIQGLVANLSLSNLTNPLNNNIILLRYYPTEKNTYRLGIGVNTLSSKVSTSDSIASQLVQFDSTYKRNDFSLSIGVEKHLRNTKRLDPYVGGEIQTAFLGREKIDVQTKVSDITGTATTQKIIQSDGGQAYGIVAILGFNYFFANKISIGAELKMGYQWETYGGNIAESIINTPVNGQTTSTFTTRKAITKNNQFNTYISNAFLLSFFF